MKLLWLPGQKNETAGNTGSASVGEMCNLGAVYFVMGVVESAGYSHLISKKALL